MHGVGTFDSPDGTRYQGGWAHDLKQGLGKKWFPNGDTYEVDCIASYAFIPVHKLAPNASICFTKSVLVGGQAFCASCKATVFCWPCCLHKQQLCSITKSKRLHDSGRHQGHSGMVSKSCSSPDTDCRASGRWANQMVQVGTNGATKTTMMVNGEEGRCMGRAPSDGHLESGMMESGSREKSMAWACSHGVMALPMMVSGSLARSMASGYITRHRDVCDTTVWLTAKSADPLPCTTCMHACAHFLQLSAFAFLVLPGCPGPHA